MKIEINIEKKNAFMILGSILILAVGFFVYAYGPNNNSPAPSRMGHSANEIDINLNTTENPVMHPLESYIFSTPGSLTCVLVGKEEIAIGCPQNSYLYKINLTSENATCKFFFSYRNGSIGKCYPNRGTTNVCGDGIIGPGEICELGQTYSDDCGWCDTGSIIYSCSNCTRWVIKSYRCPSSPGPRYLCP